MRESIANGRAMNFRNRSGRFDKVDARVLEMIHKVRKRRYAVSKRSIEMVRKKVHCMMVESGELRRRLSMPPLGGP